MSELLRDEEHGHLVGIEQRPIPVVKMQEFPRWKFKLHEEEVDGKPVKALHAVVVDNDDEAAGLGDGWCDTRDEAIKGTELEGKRVHEHIQPKHKVIDGYEENVPYHRGPSHHINPVGHYDHDHHRTDQENLHNRDPRTTSLDKTKTGPFENLDARTVLAGDEPHEATEFGPGGKLSGELLPERIDEPLGDPQTENADHPFKLEPSDRAPEPDLPNTAPKT